MVHPELPPAAAAPIASATAISNRPEPSDSTRQLVTNLTRIDLSHGPLTPQQAGDWKQALEQLRQQGPAAVPAIREFLEKNIDVAFDANTDGKLLGYPTARQALLQAVQDIGGPEALNLSLQVLQTTGEPREIAALAKYLDQTDPGKYREEALRAARETLALARGADWDGRDVKPLFELLRAYGGAEVLPDLEFASMQWKYYAAMTLAELPDGQGIPTLVRMAQNADHVLGRDDFVFHLLTQAAVQNRDARTALIEEARANQIPENAWTHVGAALAGEYMQLGGSFFDGPALLKGWGGTGYLLEANQNFGSQRLLAAWPREQVQQQLALVNELLGVTSNVAATGVLNSARTALLARLNP